MALLIATRAATFVQKELRIEPQHIYFWSDSQIVLHWLNSTTKQPVFVENRLKEIRRSSHATFAYVPTDENPADVATRGAEPPELQHHHLWWNGPKWITLPPDNWPDILTITIRPPDEDPEDKATVAAATSRNRPANSLTTNWSTGTVIRAGTGLCAVLRVPVEQPPFG
jgi:hypothetical protein